MTQEIGEELVRRFFDAVGREDRHAYDQLMANDFRGFEMGKIFDRDGMFEIIETAHRAGMEIKWSVTDARVEASDSIMTVSYVNKGSMQKAGEEVQPVSWLETAAFRKKDDTWQMVHLSSMRTAE